MIKFGTGGFRGVIGEDFNKANVQLAIQALCDMIREDGSDLPVAVGYDRRFGSDYFAKWVAEVLGGNGVRALLYREAMPSPAVMCATRDEGLDYGVMITASHNPYYFNGVKLFLKGGVDADVAFTDRLEAHAAAVKAIRTLPIAECEDKGLCVRFTNKSTYLKHIRSFIADGVYDNGVRILYDNLCGVGASCIAPLFESFGVERLDVLHGTHDAFFNFNLPNPTREMMATLSEEVVRHGYDFAMATDSDADRLGILDERGQYVNSNEILAALYYYLVRYRGQKGDVVKNCATSVLLDKLALKMGYRCHEVDVGFKNISGAMRSHDALIGGESSGGLTVRSYIFGKDSVFSSSLFLEMVVMTGKRVSQMIREVHEFAGYDMSIIEDSIEYTKEDGMAEYLASCVPDFSQPPVKIVREGRNAKYYFPDDCWALLRMSGTEPVLRVFVEMQTEADARRCVDTLRNFILAREAKPSAT